MHYSAPLPSSSNAQHHKFRARRALHGGRSARISCSTVRPEFTGGRCFYRRLSLVCLAWSSSFDADVADRTGYPGLLLTFGLGPIIQGLFRIISARPACRMKCQIFSKAEQSRLHISCRLIAWVIVFSSLSARLVRDRDAAWRLLRAHRNPTLVRAFGINVPRSHLTYGSASASLRSPACCRRRSQCGADGRRPHHRGVA